MSSIRDLAVERTIPILLYFMAKAAKYLKVIFKLYLNHDSDQFKSDFAFLEKLEEKEVQVVDQVFRPESGLF